MIIPPRIGIRIAERLAAAPRSPGLDGRDPTPSSPPMEPHPEGDANGRAPGAAVRAASEQPWDLARRVLRREWERLSSRERRVIEHVHRRMHISRNVQEEFQDERTFGERMADRVAVIGGSWRFIFAFGIFLASWIVLNSVILARQQESFDPYPYILLNLLLSTIAAVQAPIIMMSQNRQAAKDRLTAEHDYEVNLKAEIEIRALHEKLDELRERSWADLVGMQRDQIRLLEDVVRILSALPAPQGSQHGQSTGAAELADCAGLPSNRG